MYKDIKAKTIIEGFPGFGLVATIVTEYLIEHLNCELVGECVSNKLPPTLAIHKGKITHPMGVYYSKKYELVIFHGILDIQGLEWDLADCIKELTKKTGAKEVISIEGVNTEEDSEIIYYYGNEKFKKLGAKTLEESVIIGVTAALLLREKKLSCLFAQAKSTLPDSRAAGKVIEFLDSYLSLEVDPRPLLIQAEVFEKKITSVLDKTKELKEKSNASQMSYLG
jgi:uncharacterized protein